MLVPASAIGALSILLTAGLELLGLLNVLDLQISKLLSQGKTVEFPKFLPMWTTWLATVIFAFWLAFAILSVSGAWRRCVLWITALVLVAGWAPVLILAARAPDISAPFIAVLWSGVCALVYAGSHRMACDEAVKSSEKPSPKDTHATR